MGGIWLRIAAVGVLIFIIGLFIFSYYYQDEIGIFIGGEVESYGLLFLFLISALLEMSPQYIGSQFLTFNASVLGFSFWGTYLSLYCGSLAGSLAGFWLGLKYGKAAAGIFVDKKVFKDLSRMINKWGRWFILIAALSPFPYFPMVFGAFNLGWKNFILFGAVPRAFFFFAFTLIAFGIF